MLRQVSSHWPCTRYHGFGWYWIPLPTSLVCIGSILKSQHYIAEILELIFLSYVKHLLSAKFQQDNVLPHVAHKVQDRFINSQMEKPFWPICSPNLSSLKRVVHACTTTGPWYTSSCFT